MKILKLRIYTLVLTALLIITSFPLSISANELIKVGSFEGSYISLNENNERSGYGYEYLRDIAGYAGWNYQYVNTNWDECINDLQTGKIDVLGGISYTEERAEKMLFSNIPMSQERYYIYAYSLNDELSGNDLHTFDGKSIGVLKNHIPEDVLNAWESKNNISLKHYNVSSTDEIVDLMNSEKIDCFVSVESNIWQDLHFSAVTNIGESNIYFAINKNREDIKEKLDFAMQRIKDDNPFYTDDLYRRYLSGSSSSFLSKDEKQWLNDHGDIRIGYLNNDTGVSVVDPDSQELYGVIIDYVETAKYSLQGQKLEFDLKGYNTRNEQLEALHNDEIDLIFHVSQNPYSAEINNFILSDTVFTFSMGAITSKEYFDENEANTVAVANDNFALKAYISYNYPNWIIKEYDSLDSAIAAVRNKEADCFLRSSALISEYIKDKKYKCIFLTKAADVSFGVKSNEPLLLSILNKTLMSVSVERLSGAIVYYSNLNNKVTFKDFIKDNAYSVSLLIILFFTIILFITHLSLRKSKRKNHETMLLNEELEANKQELQRALEKAESANVAKASFLNNMSHDIRTPINGIIGMLNIIKKSKNDQEKVNDCLNKINESSELLLSLVNDVLDMAKLESDAVIINNESIDLAKVCGQITNALVFQAEDNNIKVSCEYDNYENLYVLTNSLYLKKILMNLFSNSMKYNKPNGSINMSMKTMNRTNNTITIEFKISDTGIGMSQDFVDNYLFEPFVQASNSARSKYPGTGLGMPIVKQLVEKLNGTIEVTSKLDEGTSFRVVIPFELDNNHIVEKEENETKSNDISNLHILLVEDNELNLEIAEFLLKDSGCTFDTATNGQEALDKFESSNIKEYDVILMDVMMPIMDGLTCTKMIRQLNREDSKTVSIIAMTANAFDSDIENCLNAGMNAHISKPLDIKVLKETICRLIENKM